MGKKLYVGNLDYATTESELAELFGEAGEVASVNLITDKMSGRSKGFAFVEMESEAGAQQAVSQLNGKALGSREIRVEEARPQEPRSSGGGGRGGSRGGGGGRGRRY
jgi:RNA recognition motif-containing protein